MPLNIAATRRLSLREFATGWDDCYLTIKAINKNEANQVAERIEKLEAENDVEGLDALLREFLLGHITGGVIMNTPDGGEAEPYEFSSDELPQVLDYFSVDWQIEALSVATGADRLKPKNS